MNAISGQMQATTTTTSTKMKKLRASPRTRTENRPVDCIGTGETSTTTTIEDKLTVMTPTDPVTPPRGKKEPGTRELVNSRSHGQESIKMQVRESRGGKQAANLSTPKNRTGTWRRPIVDGQGCGEQPLPLEYPLKRANIRNRPRSDSTAIGRMLPRSMEKKGKEGQMPS